MTRREDPSGRIGRADSGLEHLSGPAVFDATAQEYDEMWELFYAWYYTRIHHFILEGVIRPLRPRRVLDVACGTGLQSYLHGGFGARVVGLDIAAGLLAAARRKRSGWGRATAHELFSAYFDFVCRHQAAIRREIARLNPAHGRWRCPEFIRADACRMPFRDGGFDHVNLVGAFSFAADADRILGEIHRVLGPGGTCFLDAENLWNFHSFRRFSGHGLARLLMDLIRGGPGEWSGYYDFSSFGRLIPISARYYTLRRLKRKMRQAGLDVIRIWQVHVLSGILSMADLDRAFPSRRLQSVFRLLAGFEQVFPRLLPGMQVGVLARKTGAACRASGPAREDATGTGPSGRS